MAPKAALVEGFRLLRAGAVRQFAWSGDGQTLSVKVGEAEVHRVTLAVSGGQPDVRCDCRGDDGPSPGCPHLVCAMVALKKLVDGNAFLTEPMSEEHRARLLAHLAVTAMRSGNVKEAAGGARSGIHPAALCLDVGSGRFDAYPLLFGERVRRPTAALPKPLRQMTSLAPFSPFVRGMLKRYLQAHGNAWPILLRDGRTEREIRWAGDLPDRTKTGFDIRGRRVVVSRDISAEEEGEGKVLVREGYRFDLGKGTFGSTDDDPGERLWTSIRASCVGNGAEVSDEEGGRRFSVALDRFGESIFMMEGTAPETWLARAVFRVEGRPVRPEEAPPLPLRLSLRFPPEDDGPCLMRPERVAAEGAYPPTSGAFRLFARDGVPRHLRSAVQVVYEAYFDGLSGRSPKDARAAVRKSVTAAGLGFYRTKEVVDLVGRHLDRCHAAETAIRFSGERWLLVPGERLRQALLYEIPYRLFGGKIFRAADGQTGMEAPGKEIRGSLRLLHARLAEHGIGLVLDGKPVVPASWSVAVDATRREGIDWFEVRPEIRCDGALLGETAWQRILDGNGLIENGGRILIPDEKTREALALVSGAVGGKPRGRGPREIPRIPRHWIADLARWREAGVAVRLDPEDERILSRLSGLAGIEDRAVPGGMAAPLRPYQREGYSWLAFLYENRFGACLADDMGLGKTAQAIGLMAGIREGKVASKAPAGTPHLVVAPPSLLFNWENEFRKFCPAMTTVLYRGKDREARFEGVDAVLTSYDIARIDIDRLAEIPFDVIVFDEAQAVKNLHARTTGAVRRLKGRFKVALTGTPVENHVGEYCSIMDLLIPGLLGDAEAFGSPARRESPAFLEEVKRRSRPFVLRRTKDVILPDLPPRAENDVYLELTDRQKALYGRMVAEVRRTVDDAWRTQTEARARVIALTAILRLRQLCLSPSLLHPGERDGSPKIAYLTGKLAELRAEGHSALVFSQFTSFLDLIETEIRGAGLESFRLDGSTPVGRRKTIVDAFQRKKEPSLFLLSLKAGGRGLNLTKATYVFHLDPWWNPAVEVQASDRAHRIGQKRKVTVVRLLMRHTVEEKMMSLKERKIGLYRALLGDAEGRGSAAATREDFEFLLGGA